MNRYYPSVKSLVLDGRFLSILKILLKYEKENGGRLISIYFVRLTLGFRMSTAKKFISKIDKFWVKANEFNKWFKE